RARLHSQERQLHNVGSGSNTNNTSGGIEENKGRDDLSAKEPEGSWHDHAVEFASTSQCQYLELISGYNFKGSHHVGGKLDDSSLPGWFTKDPNITSPSTKGEQKRSGGLRLLHAICEKDSEKGCPALSFTKESFTIIEQHLGLPRQFVGLITSAHTRAVKFSSQSPGLDKHRLRGLIFKIAFYRTDFYQIAISYDSKTNVTHGLILSKTRGFENLPLLKRLRDEQLYCDQPLLLPLLAVELVIESCFERLHISDLKINDLQDGMGQHEYDDHPVGSPLELDFLATTRALNHVGKRVGVDSIRLGAAIIALENMKSWGIEMTKQSVEKEEVASTIDEKMTYLADTCRVLQLEAEYEEKRTGALIQVVYQFMAQKDARVNIEVAESSAAIAKASKDDSAVMRIIAIESKKDSSSMKTIATLGMIFLPGTFIAAIFSMPVFNWDKADGPFFKPHFKYYWAIVIPLTFIVLVLWALAVLLPWRKWMLNLRGKSESLDTERT
ncbi:uncharacterized protein PAC_20111, partial [Phialocephala subalpina]